MNFYQRIKLYRFAELIQILKLSIAHYMFNSIPKEHRKTKGENNQEIKVLSFSRLSISQALFHSVPFGIRGIHNLIGLLAKKGISPRRENEYLAFEYPISNKSCQIYLKVDSTDSGIFTQILLNGEYVPVIDIITKNNISLHTIVDAGANIGLTSMFFKTYFPDAKIVALEPSYTTFERLEKNLKDFSNFSLIKKGLWSKTARLAGDNNFRDGQDWAFRLIETTNEQEALFEAISLIDLIELEQIKTIDFLKIDIEGGETEVFGKDANLGWLEVTKLIAIEIHDEFNCREDIENKLVEFNFELSHSGELTIGINRNLVFGD